MPNSAKQRKWTNTKNPCAQGIWTKRSEGRVDCSAITRQKSTLCGVIENGVTGVGTEPVVLPDDTSHYNFQAAARPRENEKRCEAMKVSER